MPRLMLPAVLLALQAAVAAAVPAPPFDHAGFDAILRARVDSIGLVDYAGIKAQPSALAAYVDSLAAVSPLNSPERFPDKAHELAYWMNAYNAFVVWGVVQAYPVDSVKDIGLLSGFFNRKEFVAGGREMTLNHIENEIIRPVYQDARIHFAVNCGAVSCPALAPQAYTGAALEQQLERAVRRFAADPAHVRIDASGKLHLSKILDWYGDDFIKWFPADRRPARKPTIVDYLLPYTPDKTAAHLTQHPDLDITYNDYDWALNGQRTQD